MATPVPPKITDHAQKAIDRSPGFTLESPNLNKLRRALTVGTQNIEDTLDDLINKQALSTAEGQQLDNIGTILDLPRIVGQNDSDYSAALLGRAGALAAQSGTIEQLIQVFKLLVGADLITSTDLEPATFEIVAIVPAAGDDGDPTDVAIVNAMSASKPAGVRLVTLICETPCFLWGTSLDADANGDLLPGPTGFGDVEDIIVDGTITFDLTGAAAFDPADLTFGSVTPDLPSGNGLLLCFITGRGDSYVFTPPDTSWRQVLAFGHATGEDSSMAVFAKIQHSLDPDPTFSWTGGPSSGGTVIAQIALWALSAESTIVFMQTGAESDNVSQQDIGPISAPASNLLTKDMVVVLGHKADDWTSVAPLTGDSETWQEISEPDTTLGDDAGMVWDFSILVGTPPTITDKTFTVTGGAAAFGIGIMASFRVTKGDILPGNGGGNFARVID